MAVLWNQINFFHTIIKKPELITENWYQEGIQVANKEYDDK